MAKYQLWSRDEYGQGSIIFSSDNIDDVIKRGKEEVTNINVSNSLTSDDRERNWEAYMVLISSNNKNNRSDRYVYGGGDPRTKNTVYYFDKNGSEKTILLTDISMPKIRVYLGDISTQKNVEKEWFAQDVKRQIIETVDHQDLQGKTQFFVKKV